MKRSGGWPKLAVLFGVGFAGCASGPPLLLGQPIKKEVAILVHVSSEAAHGDDFGGTAALVDAVSQGLSKRGVRNQVYAADDDHPKPPLIEIEVEQWGEGDRAGRNAFHVLGGVVGAVGELASSGGYTVVARFYREKDADPSCERRYHGSISGNEESASADTGESVGESILSAALGDDECPPPARRE